MCILAKHFKISSIVLFILLLACVGWEVLAAENALASKIEFKKVLFSLQSEPKGEGIGGEVLVCQFPENSEWLFGEDSAAQAEKLVANRPDRTFVKYCELLRLGAYERVVPECFVDENHASLFKKGFASENKYFNSVVKGFRFNAMIRFDPFVCLVVERLPADDKMRSVTMFFTMKKIDGKYLFIDLQKDLNTHLFIILAKSFPYWQKPINYAQGCSNCLQATYDTTAEKTNYEFVVDRKQPMKDNACRLYYDLELMNNGKNLSGTAKELYDFVNTVVADYQACDPFTLKGVEKITRHWLNGETYSQARINTMGASANLWQNKIVTFDFYIQAGNNYFVFY